MNPDIFSKISLNAAAATATGSVFNTSRLARKTVFVNVTTNGSGTGAGSQLFVTIDGSADNSVWQTIDNKRYESGTAAQDDIFSYNSHFPYMRTTTTGANVGAFTTSTVITGRGV